MNHTGEPGGSFLERVAGLQNDKDRKEFDVAQKLTEKEKFTSPVDLNEQQRKNLVDTLAGVAKIDALVKIGKLAKEHNPDSALSRYLSSYLTVLAGQSVGLEKRQKEGYAKEQADRALKNIADTVDITFEGLTNPDKQIARDKKMLERGRLDSFPGAEQVTQRRESSLRDSEQIKRDLEELFGVEGMADLKKVFGAEIDQEE